MRTGPDLPQSGAAPAGVSIEQLRLQSDRAIDHGRHQETQAAALGRGIHQPAGRVNEERARMAARPQLGHQRRPEGRRRLGAGATGAAATAPPEVDRVDLDARVRRRPAAGCGHVWCPARTTARLGKNWAARAARPARRAEFKPSVALTAPARSRFYRVGAGSARRARYVACRRSHVCSITARCVEAGGPVQFHQRMEERRHGRRVGLRGPGRGVHVRPRGAVLDPARRRRRRCRSRTMRTTWKTLAAAGATT